jgi:hypothetical protein
MGFTGGVLATMYGYEGKLFSLKLADNGVFLMESLSRSSMVIVLLSVSFQMSLSTDWKQTYFQNLKNFNLMVQGIKQEL